MDRTIQFTLNGAPVSVSVDEGRMLLWVLRTDLALTGPKFGCGEGYCGACTVIVDGIAVRSCQTPVKEVEGKTVLTIEGLAQDGKLHPLQEAFMKHDALQCGYCTPGMIMAVVGLLGERPNPTDAEILSALGGHLCRCCGYANILKAIQRAAHAGRS
jgi:aerobic-type carbon monoxide dehydrogenase small subunit (CoxS/CutS family)